MYTEDGTLVGRRDYCVDTLGEGQSQDALLIHQHLYEVSGNLQSLGEQRFIRQGAQGSSHPYPPILYEVTASGVDLVARAFDFLPDSGSISAPPTAYTPDDAPRLEAVVAMDDLVYSWSLEQRVTMSAAALDIEATTPNDPRLTTIGRVGDLVVAQADPGSNSVVLARSGNELTVVQTLDEQLDCNPQRCAFEAARLTARVANAPQRLVEYVAGTSGLEKTDDESIEGEIPAFGGAALASIATLGPHRLVGWRLWRDGVEFPLPSLPDVCFDGSCESQAGPSHAAFSTTGRILAITPYGAYLYSLYE